MNRPVPPFVRHPLAWPVPSPLHPHQSTYGTDPMTSKDNPRQPEPEGTESFITITAYRAMRESRDLAEREARRLSARVVELDRQRRELEDIGAKLTAERDSLSREHRALQGQHAAGEKRITSLLSEVDAANTFIDQLRRIVHAPDEVEMKGHLRHMYARNHELANEFMRHEAEIVRLRQLNDNLIDALAKADRQLSGSPFGYIVGEPGVYVARGGGELSALTVERFALEDALVFTHAKDWAGSEWVQISRNGFSDGSLTAWRPPQPVQQEIELIVKTSPHLNGTPLRGAPNDLLDPTAGGTLACATCGCPTEDSPMTTPGRTHEAMRRIDRLEAWARQFPRTVACGVNEEGFNTLLRNTIQPLGEVKP